MKNDGKEYERFVGRLQQAILNADVEQRNIQVEINKKIMDNCGVERQFDLYWEYELGGLTYKTVIECKDYASTIPVEKVDALIGKIQDIPDLKGVFATRQGYQAGAKTKADKHKIDLLIVREQNDSDWVDADGTPLIKSIGLNFHIQRPARITNFSPQIDSDWLAENSDLKPEQVHALSGMNNQIFIEDQDRDEKYSLHDLAERLTSSQSQYGTFQEAKEFKSAFLFVNGVKLKLLAYNLEYVIPKPLVSSSVIDFSKELDGVIEYLQRGLKKVVFKDGKVR